MRIRLSLLLVFCLILALTSSLSAAPETLRYTSDSKSFVYEPDQVSPTGTHLAFCRRTSPTTHQLYVRDLVTGTEVAVDRAGFTACMTWSPDGTSLIYTWAADNTAWIERTVRVWRLGESQPRSITKSKYWYAEFTWAPDSSAVVAHQWAETEDSTKIVRFDIASARVSLVVPNHYRSGWDRGAVSWSPDSQTMFFMSRPVAEDPWSLWSCGRDGSRLSRLSPSSYRGRETSCLSPSGDILAFGANYRRLETESEGAGSYPQYTDIWLSSPQGKNLRQLTHGSSNDWKDRYTFNPIRWTADGKYLLSFFTYPDAALQDSIMRLSGGMMQFCYVDATSGEVIPALADDTKSQRRTMNSEKWTTSRDNTRLCSIREEAEISNLANLKKESPAITKRFNVIDVFDLASRKRVELLRFEVGKDRRSPMGFASFSPDGRRLYLTIRSAISEAQNQYDSDIYTVELDPLFGVTPPLPTPPVEAPTSTSPKVAPTTAPPTPVPENTSIRLPVFHITATEALSLLPQQYQSITRVDLRRNCLLVSAPPAMVAALQRELQVVDVVAPQIAVDVLVVELSQQGAKDLGLDITAANGHWATLLPVGSTSRLGPVDSDGIPLLPANPAGLGEIIYQGVGSLPKQFFAHLFALTSSGEARVNASPTVVTTSGKEASIVVRQRVNFFYNSGYDYYGRPNLVKSDIAADINVKITPLLLGDSNVNLEVDALVGSFTFKGTSPLPDTTDRQVSTALTVPQGQTMVLEV